MSFLNPALLLGGLMVAAPIIIHLINKQNYRKVEWAAMRFLREAIVRTQKRLRLEQLLLLLLRILVILLLVLMLSQPFISSVLGIKLEQDSFYAILAIDNSYSMAYNTGSGTVFDKSKEIAVGIIDSMKQGKDRVSIVLMSEHPAVPLGEASELLDKAKARLQDKDDKEMIVSDHAGNIGKSLLTVKQMVEQASLKAVRVYLITDNQKRAWLDKKAQLDENVTKLMADISKKAKITVIDIGAKEMTNVAIKNFKTSLPVLAKEIPFQFVVEVMNSGTTPVNRMGVTLFVDDSKQLTKSVDLAPKGIQRVEFFYRFRTGGPHHARVELDADPLVKDNSRSMALDVLDKLEILCVDGNPGTKRSQQETLFLEAALNPQLTADGGQNTIIQPKRVTEIDLLAIDPTQYDGIVLANVASLPEEFVNRSLEKFVQNGGGLIVFLGNRVDATNYNQVLYKNGKGLLPLRLEGVTGDPEQKSETKIKMKLVDSDHDLIQSFTHSNIPKSPFFVVFEYFNTVQNPDDKGSHVVARYNHDNAPAIAAKKFGKGHVVLFTTSAGQRWNGFGIDAHWFLPMIQDTVRYSTSGKYEQVNGEVGEDFTRTVPQELYGKELFLKTPPPHTERIPQPPIRKEKEDQLQVTIKGTDTHRAGVYTLEMSGGAVIPKKPGLDPTSNVLAHFAANIDTTESDMERFDQEGLTGLFPTVKFDYHSESIKAARDKSLGRELWRYVLWALLAIMFIEMFLAQKFGTYKV